MVKLFQGDCLEVLKTLPDNSVDLLLTDPPYVLNTNRDFIGVELDEKYYKIAEERIKNAEKGR